MTAGTVDATDIRKANEIVAAKSAEVSAAWTAFSEAKSSAIAEVGVEGLLTGSKDAFEKLDELGKAHDAKADELNEIKARRDALLSRAGSDAVADAGPFGGKGRDLRDEDHDRGPALKSFGERFVKSEVYAELKSRVDDDSALGNSRSVKIASNAELKTLLTTAAGGQALFRADRRDLLVNMPQPLMNILDIIPVSSTDSDMIEWVEETTVTSGAAEVTEGTAAGESTLAYTVRSAPIREIKNSLPATKKILRDAARLESQINDRVPGLVRKRLQGQVISGDGIDPNIKGFLNWAGILTQARSTDSRADATHKALTKIRIAAEDDAEPGYILIHPTDWETQALEKDTNGVYYLGGPASPGTQTIWGLRPVISTQVPVGAPIVIDINTLDLAINEGLSLSSSDSHGTFFTEGKVMFLATMRAGLAVTQPKAICTVTGF
jgi:HK97 family phage major capsid protein